MAFNSSQTDLTQEELGGAGGLMGEPSVPWATPRCGGWEAGGRDRESVSWQA